MRCKRRSRPLRLMGCQSASLADALVGVVVVAVVCIQLLGTAHSITHLFYPQH